jgi:hypothetical protein
MAHFWEKMHISELAAGSNRQAWIFCALLPKPEHRSSTRIRPRERTPEAVNIAGVPSSTMGVNLQWRWTSG